VVAGQRVETKSETLSKGSVGKIVVQPISISDEIGKEEKFAPRDHVVRMWSETETLKEHSMSSRYRNFYPRSGRI
jgi:hypothetical protein